MKLRITATALAAGNTKDIETEVPLKHLSNFCRTLEMLLSNCEINFILTWSADCVISSATGKTRLALTDTKLYVPVVILSSRENRNHLNNWNQVLKGINWSKYQSKVTIQASHPYLDSSIDLSFKGLNRLFDLSLEKDTDRKRHGFNRNKKVEIKDLQCYYR